MQQAKGRCVMPLSKEPSLPGAGGQPPPHALTNEVEVSCQQH
jgi:hypothetical protein